METLKQIRLRFGLTQNDVAEKIKSNAPLISNYEKGIEKPILEDAIILERNFDTRIDWQEQLNPKRKYDTVQALIELCEKYPLEMVLEFGARMYRRNQEPDSFILHYGSVVNPKSGSGGTLYPPDVKRCSECEDN